MLRRLLLAASPLLAIVAVFALALGCHLGEPERAARAFEARLRRPAPDGPVGALDFVAVSRTSCAGGCPAYDVRIDAAGRVAFTGHANTCATLPGPVAVDPAAARRLIAAASESGVQRLPDPPRRVAGDGRSTILVLRAGGSWRRITFAESVDAPLAAAIARAVDDLAGDARWLPRADAQGRASCERPTP